MNFLVAAISLGFLGSFHCIGMCGPLVLAVPMRGETRFGRVIKSIVYNSGRVLTYAMFGLVFGLLGKGFIVAGYQQALSIGLGIFILAMLLLPSKYTAHLPGFKSAFVVTSKLKSFFGKLLTQKSYPVAFLLGTLNGFLPCGLVYLGVAGAIATGDALKGASFMMAFGLGTLPAMLFVAAASQYIGMGARNIMRKAVPVFVGLTACILILRGMNMGIPYFSPQLGKSDCTQHTCCHKK